MLRVDLLSVAIYLLQNPTSNPRVQFFVRLPGNGKKADIANRKIPNLSKIQGKLARLNEAISEGLANERRQQLEARLRNSQESKVSEKKEKSLCHPSGKKGEARS